MLFTLYLDESNTDGPAPDLVLAGFLASAREWTLLLRRLHALQKEYGFTTFHATDFKRRKGDFRGWSRRKSSDLIGALARSVRDNLTEGLSITLPYKQYKEEYESTPFERGVPKFSQFGVCFEACLARAVEILRDLGGKHRLNVVVEQGHKNAGGAETIFKAMKKEFEEQGVHVLGNIDLQKKAQSEALMLADFQAHASLLSDRRERAGGLGYSAMTNQQPRRRNAGMTFIHYEPGTLKAQKERRATIAKAKRSAKPKSEPY
jgi:hypothetical protein